jgi:hypothetical protein
VAAAAAAAAATTAAGGSTSGSASVSGGPTVETAVARARRRRRRSPRRRRRRRHARPSGGGASVNRPARELEHGHRQRRGHHGWELRQRGRACRLPQRCSAAHGAISAVLTAAIEQVVCGRVCFFLSCSRGGLSSRRRFSPLCSQRARAATPPLPPDQRGRARPPRQRTSSRTASPAAAAPPLHRRRHAPVTSRVLGSALSSFS